MLYHLYSINSVLKPTAAFFDDKSVRTRSRNLYIVGKPLWQTSIFLTKSSPEHVIALIHTTNDSSAPSVNVWMTFSRTSELETMPNTVRLQANDSPASISISENI